METRVIIPTSAGELRTYQLRVHYAGAAPVLKIVFNTSEEPFERWLFYFLRELGAHIVSDDPGQVRGILNLSDNEPGILATQDPVLVP